MLERRAQCNCGQLSATCAGEPTRVSVCHCLACKRRTGSAFSFNALFREKDVSITGVTKEFVRIGEETGRSTAYGFCPDCGAILYYRSEAEPGSVVIPAGTFADPNFPPPTRSFYHRARRNPWVEITANPLQFPDDDVSGSA